MAPSRSPCLIRTAPRFMYPSAKSGSISMTFVKSSDASSRLGFLFLEVGEAAAVVGKVEVGQDPEHELELRDGVLVLRRV